MKLHLKIIFFVFFPSVSQTDIATSFLSIPLLFLFLCLSFCHSFLLLYFLIPTFSTPLLSSDSLPALRLCSILRETRSILLSIILCHQIILSYCHPIILSRHSSRKKASTGQKALLKSNNYNNSSNSNSNINSNIMNSNKKHNSLIENRIVLESAAIRIQGLVRGQQAHRRTSALRREREALKKEMEMLIVTGDLPSDHAMTLRVEGACGQLHYLVFPFSTLPLHCSLHSCSLHCCLHLALSSIHFYLLSSFFSCLLPLLTFLIYSFFLISYSLLPACFVHLLLL